jgi:hypothetical protein
MDEIVLSSIINNFPSLVILTCSVKDTPRSLVAKVKASEPVPVVTPEIVPIPLPPPPPTWADVAEKLSGIYRTL